MPCLDIRAAICACKAYWNSKFVHQLCRAFSLDVSGGVNGGLKGGVKRGVDGNIDRGVEGGCSWGVQEGCWEGEGCQQGHLQGCQWDNTGTDNLGDVTVAGGLGRLLDAFLHARLQQSILHGLLHA